ncbi:NTP transferase domain-containing protein [Candidatus Uhrbacteria bacterium]|nr:NTP transferase domain-containing protein [Candidatus Uhrbacteria bacterium]
MAEINKKIPAIVLGAGRGTRMMHPELPKVLVAFRGRAMIDYIVEAIEQSGVCAKPIVVVGYRQELVRDHLGDRVEYVIQREQNGTGDAVGSARTNLEGTSDHVLVFYGDNPFIRPDTIARFTQAHRRSNAVITLAVTTVPDFNGAYSSLEHYGRIVRTPDGAIAGIVEYKDANQQLRPHRELNTMMYAFNALWLWSHIGKIQNSNAQQEYLITDLVGMAVSEGAMVGTVPVPPEECYGINSKEELQTLERL